MADLRAPDPTLSRFVWDVLLTGSPHTAHRLDGEGCGAERHAADMLILAAEDARWVAVPCRTCFPSAPLPGSRHCDCPHEDHPLWEDPDLAWQVSR